MVTWVRASVAAVLHSIKSKLSLHDLIGTTICHFELCIEQKMENQRNFAKDGQNFFKKVSIMKKRVLGIQTQDYRR